MTDLFEKVAAYDRAKILRDHGIYPYYRVVSSGQDPVVEMNGRDVVMLGSNNYLGLSSHPEVKAAAAAALEKYGTGCAGSRLLNGTLEAAWKQMAAKGVKRIQSADVDLA